MGFDPCVKNSSPESSPEIICRENFKSFNCVKIYVSLQLRMQNVVSAQPCVGKLGISLVLLNFCIVILDCGLKLHKLSIHTLVLLEK